MRIFFDSSAWAKRYIDEEGTEEVLSWCEQATELVLSGIALPELISAFCRLLRENRIDPLQYQQLKAQLMADIGDATLVDLTPEVLRYALIGLEQSVLRGMDAVHLGSARALKVDLFISADVRQCVAATEAGLKVIQIYTTRT